MSNEGAAPNATSTATSASANAAMNVLHSFHAIGDEISALQKERHEIEADKQRKEDEMRRLQDEMAKMELAQRAATKQHAEWTRTLQELQAEPTSEDMPTSHTGGGLSNGVKLGQLERLVRESRETFVQESAEFRRECARLRGQAMSLGLADACTVAFLSAVHGVEVDADDGSAPELPPPADDTDDLDGDPAEWKHLDLDDAETKDLWHAYVESKERLVGVEQEFATTNSALQEWKQKSTTRKERVEHLEMQLRRVTNENDDLEAKVTELRALAEQPNFTSAEEEEPRIEEAVHVAPPNKKARADPPQPQQPQPSILRPPGVTKRALNPYAKNKPTSSRPAQPSALGGAGSGAAASARAAAGTDRRRDLQAIVVGRSAASSNAGVAQANSQQQQQHFREGGSGHRPRRRDKQFGCNLVVQHGTMLDASWDEHFFNTPSPPPPAAARGRGGMAGPTRPASSTALPGTSSRGGAAFDSTKTASVTPATLNPSSGHELLADDDDDDDDVLSRSFWSSGRK